MSQLASQCTTPKQIGDTRYVHGAECTWHGPIALAAARRDGTPVCPVCGGPLIEQESEAPWWAEVRSHASPYPNYEAIVEWSVGKCFPDFDTLENAWRQAMAGMERQV